MWSVSCLWDVVFVCVEDDVCKHGVCSVNVGVCSELCPVCFPIVCECVSVLL